MTNLENIKTRLIDIILSVNNKDLLEAVERIFKSTQKEDLVSFSSEQIEMLLMSDEDIKKGNFIEEEELAKSDKEWLK